MYTNERSDKRTQRVISTHAHWHDVRQIDISRLAPLADNFRGARAPCAPVVPPPMLGYMGFGISFSGEKLQIAGTSTTTSSFTPSVVEYLHALVRVGMYDSRDSCYMSYLLWNIFTANPPPLAKCCRSCGHPPVHNTRVDFNSTPLLQPTSTTNCS